MPDETSGGFYFNVLKWRGSKSVQRMSFAERGVFFEMMLEQWEKRSLPDDAHKVADLIAITEAQVSEVLAAWEAVRAKFLMDDRRPGFIFNLTMERTRRKQRENERKRSLAGREAGKASAAKRLASKALTGNDSLTVVERSSTDKKRKEQIRQEPQKETAQSAVFATYPITGTDGPTWGLTESQIAEWVALYPGLNVQAECRKALAWVMANAGRRKTSRGMPRFLVSWLNRAVDDGRGQRNSPPVPSMTEWQCPHTPKCGNQGRCDVLLRIAKGKAS